MDSTGWNWLLNVELLHSPLFPVTGIVALLLAAAVTLLRPARARPLLLAAVLGAALLVAVGLVGERANWFEGPLPVSSWPWLVLTGAWLGIAIQGILRAPALRRVLAVLLALAALLFGTLGVVRAYGVTPTVAALVGIQGLPKEHLPSVDPDSGTPAPALYQSWKPPAGMPAKGQRSGLQDEQRIPSPGYSPRPASLYLPPAALVKDPPRLPLIVFMMGQPGSPDIHLLGDALDAFAAAHNGLAPIAIVADQLGAPANDPACVDSAVYGKVASYFNTEIPAWAKQHLNVIEDPAHWVIGGYSNGGACAALWGAQHPDIWGNILDVSGSEFPGVDRVDDVLAKAFGGDRAAFEAAKPAHVMAQNRGRYGNSALVVTHGANDKVFTDGLRRTAQLARDAGFAMVEEIEIPGGDHVGIALTDGLRRGTAAFGPRLGLAPPG